MADKTKNNEPVPPELQAGHLVARTTPLDAATSSLIEDLQKDKDFGRTIIDAEIIEGTTVLYCSDRLSEWFDKLVESLRERCSSVELLAKPRDRISESRASKVFIFALKPHMRQT